MNNIFVVMGITGQVGGGAANALLTPGKKVRAIVRDVKKAAAWTGRGVELVEGDWNDRDALEKAFRGTEGVFVMVPPFFTPAPGFPEVTAVAKAMRAALDAARPPKVVALSSVGAHRPHGLGLITQCRIFEEALSGAAFPHAFVRAGWFMDNSLWDVTPARETGVIDAYLAPLDAKHPFVSTADIGALVAKTLGESWTGRRVLELEGPERYSSDDSAAAFSRVLGRPVSAKAVPRDAWAARFQAQGAAPERTVPRIEMLDGFNSGWIDFEGGPGTEHVRGVTTLEQAYCELVTR